MSNRNFVKGVCRHCSGHLEFPADAAGETINCPHCGQPTELEATLPPGKTVDLRRRRLPIIVAICVAAVLPSLILVLNKKPAPPGIKPSPMAPTYSSATNTPAKPKSHYQAVTDEFAILPFKLEKTPGSSLVYITGIVRNLSNRQRFGVKVEFSLLDQNQKDAGTATDYQSEIDPHGDWRFKALVMESRAVSAKFNSITEDK